MLNRGSVGPFELSLPHLSNRYTPKAITTSAVKERTKFPVLDTGSFAHSFIATYIPLLHSALLTGISSIRNRILETDPLKPLCCGDFRFNVLSVPVEGRSVG